MAKSKKAPEPKVEPAIEMIGPAGRRMVEPKDVEWMTARGYTPYEAAPAPTPSAPADED